MRRLLPALGLAGLVTALAATPALAAQTNTYTVHAKVTPSVRFAYTVGEASGRQPAAVKRYTIGFDRMRLASHLRKGALLGKGTIDSFVYPSADPSGKGGFACAKQLKVLSAGGKKVTLSIGGAAAQCGGVGDLPPVPAKFVPFGHGGTALQFELPANILHPVPGLTVAVRSVESSLKRGVLSPVGTKKAKRSVAVTFLTEAGQTTTVRTTA
jgi:hypothetical protein